MTNFLINISSVKLRAQEIKLPTSIIIFSNAI